MKLGFENSKKKKTQKAHFLSLNVQRQINAESIMS